MLGTVTTVISMFLDNVTTVVLIAPVTILICEILGVNPIPYLMAEALLSDTGGAATLVGDPPNILIASAAGFSFNDFLTHSLPVVVVAWLLALGLLRYLFRRELAVQPPNADVVMQLNPRESLEDPKTTRRVLIVLGGAILLFFLEELLGLSPALIALSAAAVALVWVRPDINDVLRRIEWSVLVFFAAAVCDGWWIGCLRRLRRCGILFRTAGDHPARRAWITAALVFSRAFCFRR